MKSTIGLGAIVLTLSACGSLPPSSDSPVVDFGQSAEAGKPFILHFPAGAALPIVVSVSGGIFAKDDKVTLDVRLKHDLYIYKDLISLDGKKWRHRNEMIGGKIAMEIPGHTDGTSPGSFSAEFNPK